jgi:hypothetical protein
MDEAAVSFSTLEPSDTEQVAEYERHFYQAYAAQSDNKLVRLIWDWDDKCRRLRARIPYADQVIYCQRDSRGSLECAMAVNLNPAAAFQSAGFGFRPADLAAAPDGPSCEIINLMGTAAHHHGSARAAYHAFVRDFGYADLVSRGFRTAFSTCTRRRLRPYLLLGATVLDETVIAGEARYFLRWPISELLNEAPSGSRDASDRYLALV